MAKLIYRQSLGAIVLDQGSPQFQGHPDGYPPTCYMNIANSTIQSKNCFIYLLIAIDFVSWLFNESKSL